MTLKNAVHINGDGGFIFCPIALKYSILIILIMNKMLIYFVLPLVLSFSRIWQLTTKWSVCACVRVTVRKREIFLKI